MNQLYHRADQNILSGWYATFHIHNNNAGTCKAIHLICDFPGHLTPGRYTTPATRRKHLERRWVTDSPNQQSDTRNYTECREGNLKCQKRMVPAAGVEPATP